MASSQVSTCSGIKYNYDLHKEKFNFFIKHINSFYPKTIEELNNIIKLITKKCSEESKIFRKHFAVRIIDGKKVLVKNRTDSSQKVVPLLEVFDIIAEAHLYLNHGKKTATTTMVQGHYYIPVEWIHRFVDMCNFCCHPKNPKEMDTGVCVVFVSVERLIDVTKFNHYVLFYIDQISQYVLVRPLKIYAVNEITVELFQIFSNYGVPTMIETNFPTLGIIKSSIKILKELRVPYELPNFGIVPENQAQFPMSFITDFMSSQETNVFPVLLSSMQFKLNTMVKQTANGVKTSNYFDLLRVKENNDVYKFIDFDPEVYVEDSSERPICSKCSEPVYKVYKCQKCKNKLHFTCCERELDQNAKKIIITCTVCKEYENQERGTGKSLKKTKN